MGTTFDKTATLPASFRKRNVNQEPTTSPTSPRGPGLNRNASFSKRFRKSCRNWAVQKGIVDPKKKEDEKEGEQKEETATTVEAKPAPVRRNSCPDAAEVAEVTKEDDLAAVVASLVVEAQKKKAASRSASREVLTEPEVEESDATKAAGEDLKEENAPVVEAVAHETVSEQVAEAVKKAEEEAEAARKAGEEAEAAKKAEEEAEAAKKAEEEAEAVKKAAEEEAAKIAAEEAEAAAKKAAEEEA